MSNDTLGRRINARRKECGIKQLQLAEIINVSPSAVSLWERDKALPASDKLITLAEVLHCDVNWLITGKESAYGGATPPHRQPAGDASTMATLSKEEIQLIDLLRKLPETERASILESVTRKVEEYERLFMRWLAERTRQQNENE